MLCLPDRIWAPTHEFNETAGTWFPRFGAHETVDALYAYWVQPSWAREMARLYKIGVHAFYRPRKLGRWFGRTDVGRPRRDRGSGKQAVGRGTGCAGVLT
jgi:hypothetical protein